MNKLLIAAGLLALLFSCSPKQQESPKDEATLKQDKKMEWWREARFGMFIHWGLYSIPAGEWQGERIPGLSEWIMANAEIPVKEYEQLAPQFNPTKFNAEEWVKLAKFAGMKYIVITAKHHDGFAMFDSDASDYNIVDATPFGRDPLKELAEACKKEGIRLGFYYSEAQDWHEAGGTYAAFEEGKPHWDPDLKREPLMNYIDEKAVPQVKEILENYDGLDILWWDTPWGMTEDAANKLKSVTDNYPDLITNDRLYSEWPGDFSTPEQYIPPTGLDYDWEVCMTMNTSWGYKSYDNNWKSPQTLIHNLVDIASKGGNFLLNVGPTAEGLIPDSSIVLLKEIGVWMQKNGESIYGTTASPFYKLPWGRCTQKQTEKGTRLYLHVFDWPKNGELRIPGLDTRFSDVYLLSNPKQKFNWRFKDGDALIYAPAVIFDPINTVIVVETRGKMEITSNIPSLKDGSILLPADFANIHNPGYGKHASLSGSGQKSVINNWVDPRVKLDWMFHSSEPGKYKIEFLIKNNGAHKMEVAVGDFKRQIEIPSTNNEFDIISAGEIELSKTRDLTISLTPIAENWNEVELMYAELIEEE